MPKRYHKLLIDMNILINAYAVSPSWGSEPGMGWNWISNIAKYCNLYIITEGEWKDDIKKALENHPYKEHIHFFYLPVSDKVRRICWNQGDYRFYYYYQRWQKEARKVAQRIMDEVNIDIIHHLNMVTFREPGYCWSFDKPFVWGPICGMAQDPINYLEGAPIPTKAKLYIKGLLSIFQLRFYRRINHAFNKADAIIAAVPEVREKIKKYKNKESIWIPETGCYDLQTAVSDKRQRREFNILWTGRFLYTKRLDIALRTIAKVKDLPNLHFHIVGTGYDNEVFYYKTLCKELGIEDICIWHGKVENKKVHEMMRDADLFFFTSISEATSTVIPEAINNCLPILCFNINGFGPLVSSSIGRKVELSNPEQSVKDFAREIKELYANKQSLFEMSNNCKEALKELLWENKARQVYNMYQQILERNNE